MKYDPAFKNNPFDITLIITSKNNIKLIINYIMLQVLF